MIRSLLLSISCLVRATRFGSTTLLRSANSFPALLPAAGLLGCASQEESRKSEPDAVFHEWTVKQSLTLSASAMTSVEIASAGRTFKYRIGYACSDSGSEGFFDSWANIAGEGRFAEEQRYKFDDGAFVEYDYSDLSNDNFAVQVLNASILGVHARIQTDREKAHEATMAWIESGLRGRDPGDDFLAEVYAEVPLEGIVEAILDSRRRCDITLDDGVFGTALQEAQLSESK